MPLLTRQTLRFDWLLISATGFLVGMSLLSLYSFSETLSGNSFFIRQGVYALLGIAAFLFLATLDYRHLARMSTLFYGGILLVLVLVLFFGERVRGTVGWLSLGIVQLQPVEFAKLALILCLASFIAKKRSELGEWTCLIVSFFLSAIMIFLVLRQPDLGSGLVLGFIWLAMILVSGIRWKHLLVLGILGTLLVGGSWFLLADYQKARLETFWNPELDPQGSGYNVLQSMVAVGSGGLSGKGVGQGTQSQLNFLPEKHTDFIYAVIVEELGLVGGVLVLLVYGLLLFRVMTIARTASDNTGFLIGVGIFAMLLVQITVNVGMNMGLLPVTGLPAPFLSYGGSSLLSLFLGLGLLSSIYRFRKEEEGTFMSLDRPGLYFKA